MASGLKSTAANEPPVNIVKPTHQRSDCNRPEQNVDQVRQRDPAHFIRHDCQHKGDLGEGIELAEQARLRRHFIMNGLEY